MQMIATALVYIAVVGAIFIPLGLLAWFFEETVPGSHIIDAVLKYLDIQ